MAKSNLTEKELEKFREFIAAEERSKVTQQIASQKKFIEAKQG